MVKHHKLLVASAIIILCGLTAASGLAAQPGQILLNGRVKSIDLNSHVVVVSDYEGKDVTLSIEDESIMNKFRDGRIKMGDDVNIKYTIKEGRNVPFSFRKLAGC